MNQLARATKSPTEKRRAFGPASLAISPSVLLMLVAVYGFLIWSLVISFTDSEFVASYHFVGFENYTKLWQNDRWLMSVSNLLKFSVLFVVLSVVIGLVLAIFLDQKVRAEGAIRIIYLYPMAVSLIVTGTAWKWILNPELGLDRILQGMGITWFHLDWIIDPDMAVYTLVIAAVWQTAGFVMAIFLAALRGIDSEIIKAAKMEGASMVRIYLSVILPMLRSALFTVMVILIYQAVRSYDLVVALTNGGPGYSSDLPTTFMYSLTFSRGQLGQGSASAMMILLTVVAIIVPYLYSELRHEQSHAR